MRLPVITGFGGINPAGRLSFHNAYRRLVIDALDQDEQTRTYNSLAGLMGVNDPDDPGSRAYIREHTLIRRIELFDPDLIHVQRSVRLRTARKAKPLSFVMHERQLPGTIPPSWQVDEVGNNQVRVSVTGELDALFPDFRISRVSSAGQLPTGFNPGDLYQSRSHPRGLQLTVYAAADSGRFPPIYDFGEGVIDGEVLDINSNRIVVPGFGHPVNLDLDNPYKDMTG